MSRLCPEQLISKGIAKIHLHRIATAAPQQHSCLPGCLVSSAFALVLSAQVSLLQTQTDKEEMVMSYEMKDY